MSQEDISFDETPADKVVTFFGVPIKDAVKEQTTLPGPESVDELAETPMAWAELCEGMLRELHACVEKRKFYKEREAELKSQLRKFLGKDLGMIQRGSFGVEVKEVGKPSKTDWVGAMVMIRAFVEDQINEDARKEVDKIVANNTTPGGKTTKLTPYRVGFEPIGEGDDD